MQIRIFIIYIVVIIAFSCGGNTEHETSKITRINDTTSKIQYYDGSGNAIRKEIRVNGLLSDTVEEYYSTQLLKRRTLWKNGIQGFLYEEYDTDGNKTIQRGEVILEGADTITINQKTTLKLSFSDTAQNTDMFLGRSNDIFFTSKVVRIPVVAGVGRVEFTPIKPGINQLLGVVRLKKDTMYSYTFPFVFKYFVKE